MLTELRRVESDLRDSLNTVQSLEKHVDKIQGDVKKQIQDIKITVLEMNEKVDAQSTEMRVGDKIITDTMNDKIAFLKSQMSAFVTKDNLDAVYKRMSGFMTR